jgi:predicted metal-dependent hydrolase
MLNCLQSGVALFNSGRFFDAHELLEEAWHATPPNSEVRRHLQGLVQLAVAFHHQSKGNMNGAGSVLERAVRNLEGAEASFPELDLPHLRAGVRAWVEYLAESRRGAKGLSPPALPMVRLRSQAP